MRNRAASRTGLAALAVAAAVLLLIAPAALAAPANDDFGAAEALSPSLPRAIGGSNFEATRQTGEPDHAGDPGGHSVWFSWTPTESGPVGISGGCFSSFEGLVAIYTGASVNALTPVASNQGLPLPTCFGPSAETEFTVAAGTTYWIAVDGKGGAQGSFNYTINGKPANDDFAAATAIAGDPPQQVFGSNKYAGKEASEPDHAGDPGGHSVWFAWTPSTSGPVAISTCSSFYALDTVLAVYTGSSLGALAPVASNDDAPAPEWFPGCAGPNSEVQFDAVAGTAYKVAVDSTGGTVGNFNLRLRGRPINDNFAGAVVLPASLPTNAPPPQTLQLATKQAGEPDHAGNPGGHSVWFSWTPSVSGRVGISTCGAEVALDTLLAVYTGAAVGALSQVAANDDARSSSCGRIGSEVHLDAVAGTTYRIAVDGKDGDEGRFYLNLEASPPNDGFSGAQGLGSAPLVSTSGNTRLATRQVGEPDHAGASAEHSVWFSWTAPSSGRVVVSTCPYNEQGTVPVLAIYTGSALNSLTPVASDPAGGASCSPSGSEVELSAVAGTTYRIAVDGQAGAVGLFSLEIESPPANDAFATPTALAPTPMSAGGSTRLATKEAGEPAHAGDPGGHSVWFSWTPTVSGPVEITACGHNRELDTLLAVYAGSALGSLTPVAANDDATGGSVYEFCDSSRGHSEVAFAAVAGTTYRIAVDGKGGSIGAFALAFEHAPANDDFGAAQVLYPSLPTYSGATTRLAGKEAGEPSHLGNAGGHSVWYSWTAPSSGPVALSACAHSDDLDPLLAVYTGSTVNGLSAVPNSDEGSGDCRGSGRTIGFAAVSGTTYRIAVDGRDGSSGSAQLSLEGVPANDDFALAHSLGGASTATAFTSNRFASKQPLEPAHAGAAGGASLWFKWTAPRSGAVSLDSCGSGIDTLLAVYTGSALGALSQVAANDDASGKCSPRSKLSFEAVANAVYRIAVDGKSGAQGHVELHLVRRPLNDDFAGAEQISGAVGWYAPGTTALASKQAGEPSHAGDPGGHSVWFAWTPASGGAVELDACTDGFDPLLGIYTGTAVGALTPVATTDAGTGECDQPGHSIGFDVVAGTTYRIAVDGAGGDDGGFELHLRAAIEHPRSLSVSSAGPGSVATSAAPSCASFCSYEFEVGEEVTLSAQPATGSTFAGWSGGGCSGTGPCQLALNADTAVVASFTAIPTGGGGGAGAAPPPPPPPPVTPKPKPKPIKCKPGFKKAKVKGKQKCVKKKAKPRPGKGKRG